MLVNKSCSQITKELYGFKMHIFKALFPEVGEPTGKFLCSYDLTWKTKTTVQVFVGLSFSGLLTLRCIG